MAERWSNICLPPYPNKCRQERDYPVKIGGSLSLSVGFSSGDLRVMYTFLLQLFSENHSSIFLITKLRSRISSCKVVY